MQISQCDCEQRITPDLLAGSARERFEAFSGNAFPITTIEISLRVNTFISGYLKNKAYDPFNIVNDFVYATSVKYNAGFFLCLVFSSDSSNSGIHLPFLLLL